MSVTEIQLYRSLSSKLGDAEAQELVSFIKSEINSEFMECKQVFLVKEDKADIMRALKEDKLELLRIIKEDKADLMRAIFLSGLLQYLVIMGSLIGIISFFLKHS